MGTRARGNRRALALRALARVAGAAMILIEKASDGVGFLVVTENETIWLSKENAKKLLAALLAFKSAGDL